MQLASTYKVRPNWLLRGLIGVSLAVHMLIFFHVSGIYRSRTLTFIELTIQDVSKAKTRSIPKPPLRSKAMYKPENIKRLETSESFIPELKPARIESPEKAPPDSLVESIAMPHIPAPESVQVAKWDPEVLAGEATGDYETARSYLDMVRFRIERHKKYPERARSRGDEGRVTVRFAISPDGDVREVEVTKSSGEKILDRAALRAVQNAAPFPRLPVRFFKRDLVLEIAIVFELT